CCLTTLGADALVSGGEDTRLVVWEHDEIVGTQDEHLGHVESIVANHDGTRFVSQGRDRTARIWDTDAVLPPRPARLGLAADGRARPLFHLPHEVANAVCALPDGRVITSASKVVLWDGRAPVSELPDVKAFLLDMSTDGRRILARQNYDNAALIGIDSTLSVIPAIRGSGTP